LIYFATNYDSGWVTFNAINICFFAICHWLTLDRLIYFKSITSNQVLYILLNFIFYAITLWDQNVLIDQFIGYVYTIHKFFDCVDFDWNYFYESYYDFLSHSNPHESFFLTVIRNGIGSILLLFFIIWLIYYFIY
jgi:hypothetical protein